MDITNIPEAEKLRMKLTKYTQLKLSLEHVENIRVRLFTAANTEIDVSIAGLVTGTGASPTEFETAANDLKAGLLTATDHAITTVEAEIAALSC